MDYLVFAIGVLLLSATLGVGFLQREDEKRRHWLLLGIGFVVLTLAAWLELVLFASGSSSAMPMVRMISAAVAAAAFAGFDCKPGRADKARSGTRRAIFAVVAAGLIVTAACSGCFNPVSLGILGLVAFETGWRVAKLRWKEGFLRAGCGVIFSLASIAPLIPEAVSTAFDVAGDKDAPGRILVLTLLGLGTVSAAAVTALVWSFRATTPSGRNARAAFGARILGTAFLLTLGYGAWLSHWLGNQAHGEQTSRLLSAVRLGTLTFDPARIARIEGKEADTAGEDFQVLHYKLKTIHESLPGTRFVYLVGKRNGHLVFLADAEDPASSDFSPPGMVYENQPAKWERALAGQGSFGGPDKDAWGTWFTAIEPVVSPGSGQVVAALGVDYPALKWLQPLAARRLAAMGMTFSIIAFLFALQAFNIVGAEKSRRLDQLSERLGDAMDAAELDTWEWFPKTGKLVAGPRLASLIGFGSAAELTKMSQVWRRIHPKERYHLRRLLKSNQDGTEFTSEAEVGILDAKGDYVWCMLRGRVVETDADGAAARIAGSVLNIDASHRARKEIEAQRRFALRVMQSVPTGIAVVSPSGEIRYANATFLALAGRTVDETMGTSFEALLAEGREPSAEGTEAKLLLPSGDPVPVQAYRANLEDVGGQSGAIICLVDLTSAKKAEAELRASRAEARRLALVAERTDNAVVITDRRGEIEWINEGFTRISGYSREEVVGRTPGSVLQGPSSNEAARLLMSERIAAGQGFDAEIVNYAKDGRAYVVHIECQPLHDRNNELTGFMALERDVTRERRAARLLEAVASISSTLLSSVQVSDELWPRILHELGQAADVERAYLFRSHPHPQTGAQAMSQLAEWNSGTAAPQIHNPELQNLLFAEAGFGRWLESFAAGTEIAGPVSAFPASERPVLAQQQILSLVAVPIFAGGRCWGFLGFDVCTEERHWQPWEIALLKSAAANIGLRLVAESESEALRSARDQAHQAADAAERANRAKSTFLATMSHEIRTPLNAVIGMASLLETTPLNPVQKDFAETILRSSHFLLDLINDILDYSRIESGSIELEDTPFLLSEVCKGAFDVVKAGSLGKSLDVICRIDPALPDGFRGDPGRLRQVLINLLGNAIKFTAQGFVSLSVTGEKFVGGDWELVFEIADSGIGIAPDSLERLFKPFTQEDSSTTRRFGGSGLGLAICQRLAHLMQGSVTVTSNPGHGSVFRFGARVMESDSVPQSKVMVLPADWKPRILAVDDNALNRRVLEEILASLGMSCHSVDSGATALQAWAESGPYELVLTDYRMPDMDGAQLVRHLRGLDGAGACRFVLLGSEGTYGSDIHALCDAVGTKPLWAASLAPLLAGLLPQTGPLPAGIAVPQAGTFEDVRVLVAEDNVTNQKVIRLLLKQLGVTPLIVGNGAEALDAVRANFYDVVFLDIQMPVMDGIEACRRLKSEFAGRCPVLIALTADAFREDREAALAAGMDQYLPKPVTLAALRAALAVTIETSPLAL